MKKFLNRLAERIEDWNYEVEWRLFAVGFLTKHDLKMKPWLAAIVLYLMERSGYFTSVKVNGQVLFYPTEKTYVPVGGVDSSGEPVFKKNEEEE